MVIASAEKKAVAFFMSGRWNPWKGPPVNPGTFGGRGVGSVETDRPAPSFLRPLERSTGSVSCEPLMFPVGVWRRG